MTNSLMGPTYENSDLRSRILGQFMTNRDKFSRVLEGSMALNDLSRNESNNNSVASNSMQTAVRPKQFSLTKAL